MDITPDPAILLAMKNHPLGWKRAFGELIDNAFDAGASAVHIEISTRSKKVIVSDDGRGCDDMSAMFKLGKHRKQPTTSLGMYGAGLKDTSIWLWGQTTVASLCKDSIYTASVDWDKNYKINAWDCSDNQYEATPDMISNLGLNPKGGTVIRFEGIDKRVKGIEDIVKELGFAFAPAICTGRQITISLNGKRYTVPAFQEPQRDHMIDVGGEVNGKAYRVRAGIVRPGQDNPKHGFCIAFKHRVIKKTTEPCSTFGSSRFFAWVELGKGWRPSRNKDEIIGDYEALVEALEIDCRDILKQASEQARTIGVAGLESNLSDWLKSNLIKNKNGKAKRMPRTNGGSVVANGRGSKHTTAKRVQKGSRILRAASCGVSVQFVDGQESIGEVQVNHNGIVVSLSKEFSAVSNAMQSESATELKYLIAGLIANHAATDNSGHQSVLPGIEDLDVRDAFLNAYGVFTGSIGDEGGN